MRADGGRVVGMVLALMAAGCGDDTASETTTTVPPTVATTTTSTTDPCFKFPVLVLRLQNDFREAQRGVRGAHPSEYRGRAQALVDEARSLGCPTPVGLTSFLR